MLFSHDNNIVQALFKEQRRTWSIFTRVGFNLLWNVFVVNRTDGQPFTLGFIFLHSYIKSFDSVSYCLYLKILAFLYASELQVILRKSARNNIKNILPLNKYQLYYIHYGIILEDMQLYKQWTKLLYEQVVENHFTHSRKDKSFSLWICFLDPHQRSYSCFNLGRMTSLKYHKYSIINIWVSKKVGPNAEGL